MLIIILCTAAIQQCAKFFYNKAITNCREVDMYGSYLHIHNIVLANLHMHALYIRSYHVWCPQTLNSETSVVGLLAIGTLTVTKCVCVCLCVCASVKTFTFISE